MHRIHLNIRRLELALAAALIVSLGLSAAGAAPVARDCASIQQKVVRLHILANSDSDADQAQKLRVRDRVLAETGDALAHTTSRAEAEAALTAMLPQVEAAAEAQLRADGSADRVHAELTDMYFDARTYDGGTMPAGTYRALRLTIGKGEGHNWWCVVFPPMCLSAAMAPSVDTESLDDVLTPGELELVTHPERFEVRLKVVEWWETVKNWMCG